MLLLGWRSRLLTLENNFNRETTLLLNLTLFKRKLKEFRRRFVNIEKSLIYWYILEAKE